MKTLAQFAPQSRVEAIRSALACDRPGCACHQPRARTTHCPAHADRSPSLGVDERGGRLLVHCRAGCRQEDVLAALRLRGLWANTSLGRRLLAGGRVSLLDEARERVREEAERQRQHLEAARELNALGDHIRLKTQAIAEARKVAAAMGECEEAWGLLDLAAKVERETRALELELDELLPLPRQRDLDAPLAEGRT